MTTPANPDDLTSWLRAQIDEDEQWAQDVLRPPARWREVQVSDAVVAGLARRQLADLDAKRRILDLHDGVKRRVRSGGYETDQYALAALELVIARMALPFADREGFREEWRA